MRLLLANAGMVSTSDVQAALRCSAPTARAILETLDKLGIGAFANPGPPEPATLTLTQPLRWLLDPPPTIETKATPSADGIETNPTPSTNGSDELEVERLAELARNILAAEESSL